jgi:hypothetical protein
VVTTDDLAHHAEVLTLTGDSYRTRQRREVLRTAPAKVDHPTYRLKIKLGRARRPGVVV